MLKCSIAIKYFATVPRRAGERWITLFTYHHGGNKTFCELSVDRLVAVWTQTPYMKCIDIYGVYFIKDERFTYKYYF